MSRLTQCTVLFLVVHSAMSATLNTVSIPENDDTKICLLQEKRNTAIQNIRASAQTVIESLTLISNCGAGLWYHVAHLNMSNSSQKCPSAWREYNNRTDGVRACRRPDTSSGSCPATFYPTGHKYTRVCGRVIGYQIGPTNAFGLHAVGQNIDSYYVYGVSVTHGAPRNHIWTLAAGLTDGVFISKGWECPCIDPSHPDNVFPPCFVGNNYYCESGNPTGRWRGSSNCLYSTDRLWDGQQCEGQCCSNGKSPPWFSVELPNPTTDDIEVRICIPEPSHDDAAIQLLELYVQ